jgi:hypothetical protein
LTGRALQIAEQQFFDFSFLASSLTPASGSGIMALRRPSDMAGQGFAAKSWLKGYSNGW